MKEGKADKETPQTFENRKEILEYFESAIRDWKRLSPKERDRVLDILKSSTRYLAPEELQQLRKKFDHYGILKENKFDELVKKDSPLSPGKTTTKKSPSVISNSQAERFVENLSDEVMEFPEEKRGLKDGEELKRLANSTIDDVTEVVKKWLYFDDYTVIEACLAAIIANRLRGDPFWLFVVSPSGGSKTELFRALKGKDTYELSDLTDHTLISGMITKGKDKEPSLLSRLDGKVLVMKDFTTVLSMRFDERRKILATMREMHDGYIDKGFGTGKRFRWRGKVGFLAGVTPVIDKHYGVMNLLGPRFIQYRIEHHNRNEETRRAMKNTGKESEMRRELNMVVQNFLSERKNPEAVEVPDDIAEKIIHLANYTAVVRSGISRDGRSQNVDVVPETEIPTRLAKCYLMFLKSLARVRNKEEVTEQDYDVLKKIASDSVPLKRNIVIRALVSERKALSTQEVADLIKLPTTTTKLVLEDLFMLGFLQREGRGEFRWTLSKEAKSTIEKTAIF